MITTTTGRFFAVVARLAAGSFIVAICVIAGTSNRLTVHDVLVLVVATAVAVVAALRLYRDRKQHLWGQS
jgi:hypothetical protein